MVNSLNGNLLPNLATGTAIPGEIVGIGGAKELATVNGLTVAPFAQD